MFFCYIDEAGCTGVLPSATSDVQPILVLCGLVIPETSLIELTQEFLALKRQFNPKLASKLRHDLDIVKHEIKGAEDLRKPLRKSNRNNYRRAIGFLDKLLNLMEKLDCKLIPNIYIKAPSKQFDGKALYARSVQFINSHFQHFLMEKASKGIVIADSRNHELNIGVSHSIFTQKFKASGDSYPNIVEMPLYGHSDNHVALQITDIICSALLFPIASHAYCTEHIKSIHVNSKYEKLQERYAKRLKHMSHRYFDGERYRGGITVLDEIEKRSANKFFE
ncbi:DUF3800 domain-containing protein [Thalassomonas sp. M1454]|uniref:DUF3800 domain-containing protein n=1 Tax=Thalassomonas sp. M1454 TaxID=2594477 RepID=UPI00117D7EE1|nr:DUF3800 domain-containing protein [Thalassomonas sp. M1454]TRX53450.1 DUF3800 domain-containing protein [Thalassomonas sp. M1454]